MLAPLLHIIICLNGKDKTESQRDIQLKRRITTSLAPEIYVDSCGRKGIGETPQCASTRRLTSRPRKAKYISGAGYMHYLIFYLLLEFFVPVSLFESSLTCNSIFVSVFTDSADEYYSFCTWDT